jgi:hypothetical protein
MQLEESGSGMNYEGVSPDSIGETAAPQQEQENSIYGQATEQQPNELDGESQAPYAHGGAEVEALQELVYQKVGPIAVEPEEHLPDPESIERISNEKIKAMRKLAAGGNSEVVPPFQEQVGEIIIRAYSNFKTFFIPPPKERRYCELNGHECKHCGQVVESLTQQKIKEAKEKGKRK